MSCFSWRHTTIIILVAGRPETWQLSSQRELHFSLLDEKLSILVTSCCYEVLYACPLCLWQWLGCSFKIYNVHANKETRSLWCLFFSCKIITFSIQIGYDLYLSPWYKRLRSHHRVPFIGLSPQGPAAPFASTVAASSLLSANNLFLLVSLKGFAILNTMTP